MDGKERKRVGELVEQSMNNLSNLVDVDTVIGKPIITASGFQIIPVTKVTMGYLSGGGEFGETKVLKEDETAPFAGGSGAVVSLKPAGFVLDDGKSLQFVHAGEEPIDNLIDKASDLIRNLAAKNE